MTAGSGELIRAAEVADAPQMIELCALKREAYERYSPLFWREAEDASIKQQRFFERQLQEGKWLAFVAEAAGVVSGFITGQLVTAPPVYDPGGQVCLVDDFVVRDAERWLELGAALFRRLEHAAREAGAVLTVTVCGAADEKKLELVAAVGATPTTYWCVKPIPRKSP
jgi:GNAT superfamily N-acetyltransferase